MSVKDTALSAIFGASVGVLPVGIEQMSFDPYTGGSVLLASLAGLIGAGRQISRPETKWSAPAYGFGLVLSLATSIVHFTMNDPAQIQAEHPSAPETIAAQGDCKNATMTKAEDGSRVEFFIPGNCNKIPGYTPPGG